MRRRAGLSRPRRRTRHPSGRPPEGRRERRAGARLLGGVLLGGALLGGSARAELPPPDYREELFRAAAAEVRERAEDQGPGAAAAFAAQWARQVGADAEVAYEVGLAWRFAGEDTKARAALDEALRLDEGHVAARYDRGELRLAAGELDGAEADFRVCVEKAPAAWPGHFRLADVAGRRHDVTAFERHLSDALQRGFTVRAVLGDPTWLGFTRDAALGAPLHRLVLIYEGEEVWRVFSEGGG